MLGQSFLRRSLTAQSKYGAMVSMSSRGFAGGGKKRAAMDPATTEYDLVIVGKCSAKVTKCRRHQCDRTDQVHPASRNGKPLEDRPH